MNQVTQIARRPQCIIDALRVVNDPENYADNFGLRVMAWAQLKAERGQTVSQTNLQELTRQQRCIEAVKAATGGDK